MTFISDIGYRVRPHVDIGYRHLLKFTYRSDTTALCKFFTRFLNGCRAGQNVNRPGRDSVNFATWARLVVRNSLLSDDAASATPSIEGSFDDYCILSQLMSTWHCIFQC